MLKSFYYPHQIEAGCDEAGRGCLAGPVFAAAVIFPNNYKNNFINDSKQLSEKKRYELKKIIENDALSYAIAKIDTTEIDNINILQASIKAMNMAIKKLTIQPDFLLIDGNRFHTDSNIPFACIVKGDATFLSIAAASILAKVYRDEYMIILNEKYPHYKWNKNKGYPSLYHRQAILNHGITEYHRKSFNLYSQQFSFDF